MPRRMVQFLPQQYYHFYNRGNNRQAVFFERDNYLYFLKGVKEYLCPCLDIIAYCLMPTHYHMLVRVKEPGETETSEVLKTSEVSVSRAMQKFGISYTKAINKRFDRVGALFQGSFQSKPVEDREHLINACVYIHINPIKHGRATAPEEWEFSNYLEWLNLRPGTLVDREFIQEHFGTPEAYRELVSQTSEVFKTSEVWKEVWDED